MVNLYEGEETAEIFGFPRYVVTNLGRVLNTRTGREMVLSPTGGGTLTVGLMQGDHQYRRSVKLLVARAFVEGETELFNTPVQLDGVKTNCRADNIVWRPRSFAWEWARQFVNPPVWFFSGPVIEEKSGVIYPNVIEASMKNGVLCVQIRRSIINGIRVFPTRQIFNYTKGKMQRR